MCLCPKCAKHLGWMFEPVESAINEPNFPSENGFYALIYKEILGESCNQRFYFCICYALA